MDVREGSEPFGFGRLSNKRFDLLTFKRQSDELVSLLRGGFYSFVLPGRVITIGSNIVLLLPCSRSGEDEPVRLEFARNDFCFSNS